MGGDRREVLERLGPAAGAARAAHPARVGRRLLGHLRVRAAGRQLLADHPQRQELVALEPEDRLQPLDVAGGIEPVAAGRSPRREQLLGLQVADLRDRDVRELALELLDDSPDREGLLPRCALLDLGAHLSRYVSLYLPTWSSSPFASLCDSIRRLFT